MKPPRLSPDEPLRLAALRATGLVETPLQERFERITRLAKRLLDVEIAAISLVESDRQWFLSIQGLNVCETSRDVSFCGHAILGSEIMVVPDARKDPRFADNPRVIGPPNVVFYASCPVLTHDGFAVGTLCVNDSKPREISEEDRQCLRDLASLVEGELRSASALAMQAALMDEVATERRRAEVDSLTRMWNRAGILRLAEEALERARVGSAGVAFVMADMDHFKSVNDTFGHAAGDDVLRTSARRMLSGLRESDYLGRLGGDEFLLVLSPCDSIEGAERVTRRVRDRLTASPISSRLQEIPISASFGVAYVEAGATRNLDCVLSAADAALYGVKRSGRGFVAASGRSEDVASLDCGASR